MIEDKYIELINRELDGVNSQHDSAALKEYLGSHSDAKRYYEELRAVARMFSEAGELEPPAELRRAILCRVFGTTGAGDRKRKGVFSSLVDGLSSLVDGLRPGFNKRYAYVFAAGVVVGVCLLAFFARMGPERTPTSRDNLYGTLMRGGGGEKTRETIPTRAIRFESPRVSGAAEGFYSGGQITVSLQVSAESRVRVVFGLGENVRFESVKVPDGCEHTTWVSEGKFELSQTGACDYVVVFKDVHGVCPPIPMSIEDDSGVLFYETIVPERK